VAQISRWHTWFPATLLLLLPLTVAAAEPDYSKDPVLFVHGYFLGEAGTWSFLKKRLVEQGWPEEYLFSFQFESVFGCNPKHGEEIEAHAQELMAWTGKERFDIACHSMGCVDSRWWIRHLCGYGRVNDFVSIAGANLGSVMACLEPVSCGADALCVGSQADAWKDNPFLLELNGCDQTPWDPIRYTSIWTALDEIVVPSTNSKLEGALNVQMKSVVGHALILTSEETVGYLVAALDGGGKNDNAPPGPEPCVDVCDSFPNDPLPEVSADEAPVDAGDIQGQPEIWPEGVETVATHDGEDRTSADSGTIEADRDGTDDFSGVMNDAREARLPPADGPGEPADSPPLHLIRTSKGGCGTGSGQSSAPLVLLLALVSGLLSRKLQGERN